ncbi:uncharacterized protein IUM83_05061 [Phytophthora cinnamomi]|nr:hypothetical protein IUM83_05061 [Phytophthora cinnamomi]
MDLARSSVDVRLLTYADTEWDMTINGNVYSYIPDETGLEIEDEAQRLQAWFEALNDDESLPLEIQVIQQEADSDTRSATFNIRFLGTYIDELYQYAIVNPTMIPSFAVAAGTTDGSVGSAQGYVTLPELVVYSDLLKPQYSKLINLLSHGIAGATTSSAPSPTPTSASTTISADDPCRQNCQHAIDSCRADADCLTFQTSLASLLGSTSMELSVRPQNDYGAARVALNMSSVLNSSVSAPSGTAPPREHWDAFALEIACFNATSNCDLEYDDVVSPFSGSHVMTSLTIEDVSASVSIRSYPDTAWIMWLGVWGLWYTPDYSLSPYNATVRLSAWIKAELGAYPFFLTVEQKALQMDSVSGSGVITLSISALATDTTFGDAWLAPPWLIPRFEVLSGTAGGGDTGLPPAEANASLWDVAVVSIGQLPQFSKLLNILESGLDR